MGAFGSRHRNMRRSQLGHGSSLSQETRLVMYDVNKFKNAEPQLIRSMSEEHTFDAFMDHYAMDFNIKNLICWVELIQFAQFIRCDDGRGTQLHQKINFFKSIPLSAIVFDGATDDYADEADEI